MPHAKPKWPRLPGRLWRDREGASLLEFTVVLPFLIVFALGVFEFGNALFQYNQVTAGVRDAGRYLASASYEGASGTDDTHAEPDNVDPDESRRRNARRIAVCGDVGSCTTDAAKRVSWWPADIADIDTEIQVQYCINGTAWPADLGICDCATPPDLNEFRGFGSNKVCVSTTPVYGDLGFLGYLGLGPLTFTINHEQRYYGIR
jgi:hypothetical protein